MMSDWLQGLLSVAAVLAVALLVDIRSRLDRSNDLLEKILAKRNSN